MASLSTELQNRHGAQFLIQITNPQLSSATMIDTTRLNAAIADCVEYFRIYAGESVDSAAPTAAQIAAAIPTIVEILKVYSGQLGWHVVEASIIARLEGYAKVNARDRIKMTTDSTLEKTADPAGAKVAFDYTQFKGYVPRAPSSGTTNE